MLTESQVAEIYKKIANVLIVRDQNLKHGGSFTFSREKNHIFAVTNKGVKLIIARKHSPEALLWIPEGPAAEILIPFFKEKQMEANQFDTVESYDKHVYSEFCKAFKSFIFYFGDV